MILSHVRELPALRLCCRHGTRISAGGFSTANADAGAPAGCTRIQPYSVSLGSFGEEQNYSPVLTTVRPVLLTTSLFRA